MANPVKPVPDGFHTATPYMIIKAAAEADGTVRHAHIGNRHYALGSP